MPTTNSKIRILCDLCGKLCGPQEVKQVKFSDGYCESFWVEDPTFKGEHFVCKSCLTKIGWFDKSDLLATKSDPLATAEPSGEAGSVKSVLPIRSVKSPR